MFIADLFIALLVALLLAGIIGYGFGRPGPWGGVLWFFLVVFLGAWAMGVWATPVGPAAWGVAWLPIFFGGLIVALIVAAFPHPPAHRSRETAPPEATESVEAPAAVALGAFFWVLVLALLAMVFTGYWWS